MQQTVNISVFMSVIVASVKFSDSAEGTHLLSQATSIDLNSPLEEICGVYNIPLSSVSNDGPKGNDFPWIVQIPSNSVWNCTGSLISKRYVLTSARCLDGPLMHYVKLGAKNALQYPASAEIERIIVHPQYNTNTKDNNIGLIQLKDEVTLTNYIRPICLLTSNRNVVPAVAGDTLYTVSNGLENLNYIFETATMTVPNMLINNEECLESCRKTEDSFDLTNNDMCVKMNSTMCSGTDGGPLMRIYENQWYQEGIIATDVSEGCKGYSNNELPYLLRNSIMMYGQIMGEVCGDGRIVVTTRVSRFMSWIEEHVRA